MARPAWNRPAVSPPCTTSRPTRARAATWRSKGRGLRSPVMCAKPSTSSGPKVRVREARDPTAGGTHGDGSATALDHQHILAEQVGDANTDGKVRTRRPRHPIRPRHQVLAPLRDIGLRDVEDRTVESKLMATMRVAVQIDRSRPTKQLSD